LPSALAKRVRKYFIHAAEQIDRAVGLFALAGGGEADGGDEVDEFAEAVLVEAGAGVVFGSTPSRRGSSRSMATMASSTILPMVGCLALAWRWDQRAFGGHPEDVLGFVFVRVFRIGPRVVAFARHELGAVLLEGVGDVFQEDEPEDDVLILSSVHVVAEFVGWRARAWPRSRWWRCWKSRSRACWMLFVP